MPINELGGVRGLRVCWYMVIVGMMVCWYMVIVGMMVCWYKVGLKLSLS